MGNKFNNILFSYSIYNMEDEDLIEEELLGEQAKNKPSPADRIRPWMYKKGQSGNPSGRPKGISLKEYARLKFASMTEDEREEFLEGIEKHKIWEMSEGKAEAKTDLTSGGEKLAFNIVHYGDSNTPQVSAEKLSDTSSESTG